MLFSKDINLPFLQRLILTTTISLGLASPFVASLSSTPEVDLDYEIHQGWFNVKLPFLPASKILLRMSRRLGSSIISPIFDMLLRL